MNHPVSPEERAKIINLYDAYDLTIEELANRFKRGNGTIQRILDASGVTRKRRRPRHGVAA